MRSEYIHPFVCLMMMLLFDFRWLFVLSRSVLAASSVRFCLTYCSIFIAIRFWVNKCSARQFKILSARFKNIVTNICCKCCRNSAISPSPSRLAMDKEEARIGLLSEKYFNVHWMMPRQSTIRLSCSSFHFLLRSVVWWTINFLCKPLKWF